MVGTTTASFLVFDSVICLVCHYSYWPNVGPYYHTTLLPFNNYGTCYRERITDRSICSRSGSTRQSLSLYTYGFRIVHHRFIYPLFRLSLFIVFNLLNLLSPFLFILQLPHIFFSLFWKNDFYICWGSSV